MTRRVGLDYERRPDGRTELFDARSGRTLLNLSKRMAGCAAVLWHLWRTLSVIRTRVGEFFHG